MIIAIIGTGSVGSTLGRRLAQHGHTVVFGSREPQRKDVQSLVAATGTTARAARPADAVTGADVVMLATPWDATEDVVTSLAPKLDGTILVDCTNPLTPDLSKLTVSGDTSAGEQVAAWAPQARVVKAFNTTGTGNMDDPDYDGVAATMFVCGDDDAANATVVDLAEALGFDAVDCGPLSRAGLFESLAMLWIHLAYSEGQGPDIAFKLLRR